jgi:geranylgeranyl pyrophosphate synthase
MEWAAAHRARFDAFLDDRYRDAWPTAFTEPLRYPVFGGGKRFRPLAALAAYEACAADPTELAPALPCAAAVELVHTYSLVHDDLPAMDGDLGR